VTYPLASLHRARLAVSLVFCLNGFGVANWAVRIPDVKKQLGLSDGVLGFALLAIALGSLLTMPLMGGLAARFGSRPVVGGMALFMAVALLLPPLAPNLWWLLPTLLLLGAGNGGLDVVMNVHGATVERHYPHPIMSSFHAMWSVGGLAGAAFAGLMANQGVSVQMHLLWAALLMGVLFALVWNWLLPASADQSAEHEAKMVIKPNRLLLLIALLGVCTTISEGAVADWSAVYLREGLNTSAGFAALGYAAFQTAMIIMRFLGDGLNLRFGPERLIRVCGAISGFGLGLALWVAQPWAMLIGFACVGLGMSVVFPGMVSAAGNMKSLPSGPAISWVASVAYAGFLAGPPLIGWIAELTSLRFGLALVALMGLLVMGLAGVVRAEK
jgi:MFS family permease